jgi:hypothetical protein
MKSLQIAHIEDSPKYGVRLDERALGNRVTVLIVLDGQTVAGQSRLVPVVLDRLKSDGMEHSMASANDRNPLHHTQKMQQRLKETVDHLRQDIEKVDEPQLKAMFETAAEVLNGLVKAFRDYEQKNEAAWRRSA